MKPKTPRERIVGACGGQVPAEQRLARTEDAELVLQIEDRDGSDDGPVDVAEPADGDHHDELEAEDDHEVLGAEELGT